MHTILTEELEDEKTPVQVAREFRDWALKVNPELLLDERKEFCRICDEVTEKIWVKEMVEQGRKQECEDVLDMRDNLKSSGGR